jgi:hypothetical protein
MASQLRRVSGNKRLRSSPHAQLQAKISALPQSLANKQQREIIARDTSFQNKQIGLQKKQQKFQKRQQQAGMGLEAAKLGMNLATSDLGGSTIGQMAKGVKETFGGPTSTPAKSGGLYDMKPGVGIASGLTGWGVGQMIGGKNKKKKAAWGAAAGGLMGLLGGGGNLGTAGMGALAGGLGGLF